MSAAFYAIGLILVALGMWQGWKVLLYVPATTTDAGEQVASLIAINEREMFALIAVTLVISGVLFICTGAILQRTNRPHE